MSEKKENREEEKEQSSSRSGLNDEQIEAALNACTFGNDCRKVGADIYLDDKAMRIEDIRL